MIFYGTFLVLTNISDKSIKNYLFNSFIFLIAVFVGSSLSQISGIEVQKTFLLLLVYGFIACSFLIIPGISGSAFLLAIGVYPEIIAAISNLNMEILFPFAIGMLTAIFIMPKVIYALFKQYESKILVRFGGFSFGANSPFSNFVKYNVKFLNVGIKWIDTCTYLHHLEHLNGINHRFYKPTIGKIIYKGKLYKTILNPPDQTGKQSISIPWQKLEYPEVNAL